MKLLAIVIAIFLAAILAGIIWARTASRPSNLGVQDGRLAPLPETPNGVATQSGTTGQRMEPISFSGDQAAAQQQLLSVLKGMPRVEILVNEPGYVWAVFRSALFGFADDVEFSIDDDEKVIHFRSASRLGYSDLGVNRKRTAEIRRSFEHRSND